ncbi:arsenite methyltransferase [bacterium]|nr:arsenite methyltransferase [bacterium]
MNSKDKIHEAVRDRYGKAALGCGCSSGCCGAPMEAIEKITLDIGYHEGDLIGIPEGANLGLGCGNPLEYADVKTGETVLDLGSGAGFDVFLASRAVGPQGRVIGVDMTPAMVEKARENARKAKVYNVDFRLGKIEELPVNSETIDLIISNCVVNLSPEKDKVFAEAYRVLNPGGRMLVSDLVLIKPLSEELRNSVEAYVGCVAGASMKEDYLQLMRDAGFEEVKIVAESGYDVGLSDMDENLIKEAYAAVTSVKVRAVKKLMPCRGSDCCC